MAKRMNIGFRFFYFRGEDYGFFSGKRLWFAELVYGDFMDILMRKGAYSTILFYPFTGSQLISRVYRPAYDMGIGQLNLLFGEPIVL